MGKPYSQIVLAIILRLLSLIHLSSAQCAACANYGQDLSICSYNFNGAVATGQGAIGSVAVGCMCITGSSGLSGMVNCYGCNDVTGSQLQVLELWVVTCNTVGVSGMGAAVACWNTNTSLCVPYQGVPLPSVLASVLATANPAAPSTSGGSSPALTTPIGSGTSTTSTVNGPSTAAAVSDARWDSSLVSLYPALLVGLLLF